MDSIKNCPECGSDNSEGQAIFTLTPETKNYAKLTCWDCGKFFKWVKKPQNEGKRTKTSKWNAWDFDFDGCELCRRPRIMLGYNETLEVHHKDIIWEHDDRKNVLLLCTLCHKQVHIFHAFLYLHYLDKPAKGTADYF